MGPKTLIAALALVGSMLGFAPAWSADFPERPVKIIVPVAAGGGSDILARAIADRLSAMWPQRVFIDNRPGAGHMVGTGIGAKSDPDGHTIMMVGLPHLTNPYINPPDRVPYKIADFDPVILLAQLPNILVTHPDSGFKSVADVVAFARSRPGDLNFASIAGANQLAIELLKMTAKINLVQVPYNGSAAALPDILSGRVAVMFDALVTAKPNIEAGKLRPLAVTIAARAPELPAVPTMQESGFPDFLVSAWLAFLVPKGTPAAIIDKINADVAAVLRQPDLAATLRSQTWSVMPLGPSKAALAGFLKDEEQRWSSVIKAANIKAQ